MAKRKQQSSSGELDNVFGFSPGESIIRWVFENYHGKHLSYREIERMFLLDVSPNYNIGVILSAFDLCGIKINPNKRIDLPPQNLNDSRAGESTGKGSFIDEYIREICIFPTLNREEETELAKLMEVHYIRYKSSLFFCSAVLDELDKRFHEVSIPVKEGESFNLGKLKQLVVPGTTKLPYPKLWKLISYQWDKVREAREKVNELEQAVQGAEDPDLETMVRIRKYKFAIAFILKDLQIKENVLHQYRQWLPDIEHLHPEQKEDFRRVENNYERYIECKNLMVNYNLKLVVSIARKFFRAKVPPMDVIQYGNEGLIRAAEDFNYKLKFKFSTYAIWWIRQKIQEGIQEQEHLIRIPAYRLHLSRKYSAIKERLAQEGDKPASDEELAKELDMSVDQIKKLKSDPSAFVISPQGSEGNDEVNILEQLVDKSLEGEDKMFDDDATAALQSHLKLYPLRERYILTMRYGLICEDITPVDKTIDEVEELMSRVSEDVTDKEIDEKVEPILYQFNNLSTEVKVPVEDFKKMKTERTCSNELLQKILPHTKQELENARFKLETDQAVDGWEETLLALVDGYKFDDFVKFKSRDRIILVYIWHQIELKASVVRKMLNHEGLILEDVAKVFGLTKERVRQIEAKILRNISYHLVLP